MQDMQINQTTCVQRYDIPSAPTKFLPTSHAPMQAQTLSVVVATVAA